MADVSEVKARFLQEPKLLAKYLSKWFYNISIHKKYISFGRAEDSSSKGMSIYLENNSGLYLKDYSKGIHQELFSYLIDHHQESFRDLMGYARKILGLSNEWKPKDEIVPVFGGLFDAVTAKEDKETVQTYPESVLDDYDNYYVKRFLNDGINRDAQDYFNVRFDTEANAIVFPIRNNMGEIIGIKARVNTDHPTGSKYYYPIQAPMSQTLYGYSENYSELQNENILIFEAEKSVMQCFSMGIRNAVALGSSSISDRQIELLLSLSPRKIILAYDQGIDSELIYKTAYSIYNFVGMKEVEIEFIDLEELRIFYDVPDKSSPSDLGKNILEDALKYFTKEIKRIEL